MSMHKMQTVKLYGGGVVKVEDAEVPTPQKGEVLVKVYASAICGSEKSDYLGNRECPTFSGHETVGVVEDANGSTILKKGDRVALYALYGCGECHYCIKGDLQFCTSIQGVSNSGHAQYTVCRDVNCIKIDDDIHFDEAVLLYGDSVGVAHRAIKSCDVQAGKTAYVVGAGPIGLGIIAYLKHLNVHVIAGEPSSYRRNLAVDTVGAAMSIDPLNDDVVSSLLESTGGIGPDYVFECSGTASGEMAALEVVKCGGSVCFAGENYNELSIIPSKHIIHREVHLTGAFYYSPNDVKAIISEHEKGLDVCCVVSHKFPLLRADKAFAMFMKGETGKVILHPWEDEQ